MDDHEHLTRWEQHRQIGLLLAETPVGHPWGCVACFYAAFHVARWAMLMDRRFDDLTALKAIHPHLQPDDRRTNKHKARRGSAGGTPDFGVNDLVLLLYPSASRSYERLHQASIEVRYEKGDPAKLPSAEQLEEYMDTVYRVLATTVLGSDTTKSGPAHP